MGAAAVRVDDRQWHYGDVACERCGACVLVAKFSPQHTSIQWSQEAVLGCAEFAAAVATGEPSALIATCLSLRASVGAAVTAGRIGVIPP